MKRIGNISVLVVLGMFVTASLSGLTSGALVDPTSEPGLSAAALWYFDEGSGQTAYDSSGNANHGQLGTTSGVDSNDPAWTTDGVCGGALSFDGLNDYVLAEDSESLDITEEITIDGWVYREVLGAGVIVYKKTLNCLQYGVSLSGTTVAFSYRTACGPGTIYQHIYGAYVVIGVNEWHHVAVRYISGDAASAKILVDGVEIPGVWGFGTPGDGTGHMTSLPSDLLIGAVERDSGAVAGVFNGLIDEVDIFDRALTDSEIQAIYNAGLACLDPNVPPEVMITGPEAGSIYPVNTDVTFTGTFTDANTEDTHTAEWRFESKLHAIVAPGTVTESDGSGTVTGTHAFTAAGVYMVTLTVTDDDDGVGTANTIGDLTAMVVIYDPSVGFVTGGGWFESPPGALAADSTATGRAGFGFFSKYQKGADVPTGNAEFRFHAGDIMFHSTSYDWLVVAGHKAMFKGEGKLNGEEGYGFMISAIDGDLPGGEGVDKFRIKIWDLETEEVIYDNNPEGGDDDDPTTPVVHGQIKIHR